ncbi:2OG-Fe(II) oxygenase [Zavarzinella formosa]|uniref:2OG-Fe(II) oxygenase n=1 Tax=Zavarzinella formosa TaxID=360055 RepID=UPI0002F89CA4|nr:2OG-Fe(II) oxygenase [Zavarzinella formosa]
MQKEELLGDDIFVIHNFLTAAECEILIGVAEAGGFEEAPINTTFGVMIHREFRNNTRVMIDDEPLAAGLFDRVKSLLPERIGRWEPCGLNERFRHYRYVAGQKFEWHFDGAFHRNNGESSKLTFMIYLNGGFSGGNTAFNLRRSGVVRDGDPLLRVQPAAGLALVFRHDLLHTGEVVTEGVKYVMRSDVMCRMA